MRPRARARGRAQERRIPRDGAFFVRRARRLAPVAGRPPRAVGARLEQARKAYDDAYSQLSTGAGNLVGQTEKLRQLGAKHTKQLEAGLIEKAAESDETDDSHLQLVQPEDDK